MGSSVYYIPIIGGSLITAGIVLVAGGQLFHSLLVGSTTAITSATILHTQRQLLKARLSQLELLLDHQAILADIDTRIQLLQDQVLMVQKTTGLGRQEEKNHTLTLAGEDTDNSTTQHGSIQKIIDFLADRGITIKNVPPADHDNPVLSSIAYFLGENYEGLAEVLGKIKRNMQQGTAFTLSIKDYTQKDMSNVCQFCTRLHQIAFLEEYRYFKSPQYLVKARPATLPAVQNFFSGKWLESYVLTVVHKCVNSLANELQVKIELSYLANPQVTLANGDDFELDLICCIDDYFVWIEAKSGDYQQHISRYARIAKMMNLDNKHAIMVLCSITEDNCQFLSHMFSMTVCNLNNLAAVLTDVFRSDLIRENI